MKQIFHFKHPVRKRLVLYLIKPSKYDDDGYVIRYWKGVCPSNTLACLNGLSEDVRKRGALGGDMRGMIERALLLCRAKPDEGSRPCPPRPRSRAATPARRSSGTSS